MELCLATKWLNLFWTWSKENNKFLALKKDIPPWHKAPKSVIFTFLPILR